MNRVRRRPWILVGLAALVVGGGWAAYAARAASLRRFAVVAPRAICRGAWPSPTALRSILDRERIRTVVTLTAINRDDPKYIRQEPVVREARTDWVIVPMRGSTATLDQLVEAADLLADPARQPVFFHCVGGHHRSNLVQAAYRIRHQGWSADRAWAEIAALPWTRPEANADRRDREVIVAFAARYQGSGRSGAER